MRLAEFIQTHSEPILAEWEVFARSIWPGTATDPSHLRDHAAEMLTAAAADMKCDQNAAERSAKSKGEGRESENSDGIRKASESHGASRVTAGFDLAALISEYRALRASVVRQWLESCPNPDVHDIDDLTRFHESIDQSLALAINTYKEQADSAREKLLANEQAARKEAEEASRAKDNFLATLSHEVRTPLNAITGWIHIMRHSGKPDDIAKGIDVIERNAHAQSQIIEDLLDMSRIISGKVRLDVEPIDLTAILQAAIDTARPTAEAKDIKLTSVIDSLEGVTASGDANRLQQVLWNLLTNAIKFTPKHGRIQVLLQRVDSHLDLRVIDSGEGIEPDFLPFVFDRFRQSDGSSTRRHGGLGLGLSIVKQLVEMHGGSVRVDSAGLQHGSTFTVALPFTSVQPETRETKKRRQPRGLPQTTTDVDGCIPLHGVRVLVVDDEEDAREMVKRLLEDCGTIVTTAASANEAVGLIEDRDFDVLVSDIGMPHEDGFALIKRVLALGKIKGRAIPAIALTAYARAQDRIKIVSAGFHTHVAKPVEPAELITVIAGAVGRTGTLD